MAHEKDHDYHILQPSIWPFAASVGAFVMLFGAVKWMNDAGPWLFLIGLAAILYTMFGWWSDTIEENAEGDHTPVVQLGLRYGFILFIMSEVMFFAAWFWSFFKHALYPMEAYEGTAYAAPDFYVPNAFELPLMNTVILLLSGCAVTWAHHALVHDGDRKEVEWGLLAAVLLGVMFTGFQAYEYRYLIVDQGWIFGGDEFFSNFFMATGFHGLHVIIGTIFLFVCWLRVKAGHFTADNHVGFEAAAWYWHFVDVVWLFLFFSIYLWGL